MSDILFRPDLAGPRVKPGMRLWLAAAWAGHGLLLAALLWVAPARRPAEPPPGMAVDMVFAPATPREARLASVTLAPSGPVLSVASLADPGRIRVELPVSARRPGALRPRPAAPGVALAPPPSSAPAGPPPSPHAPSPGLIAALEARIHDAVQLAAIYPPSARMMHREGRAQICFDYRDGAVDALSVAQSSHSSLLDHAAIEAVRHAAYPKPPGEIGAARLRLAVWVNFALTSL